MPSPEIRIELKRLPIQIVRVLDAGMGHEAPDISRRYVSEVVRPRAFAAQFDRRQTVGTLQLGADRVVDCRRPAYVDVRGAVAVDGTQRPLKHPGQRQEDGAANHKVANRGSHMYACMWESMRA